MNQTMLYVMSYVCLGNCHPAVLPSAVDGGLIFTSLDDCQSTAKKLDDFDAKSKWFDVNGREIKHDGWHYLCLRAFFADYAQTERLTDGRVTCSYTTRMPQSVMARRIDPYEPQHHCAEKHK